MLSWLVLVRHGVGRGLGSRLRLLVLRAGPVRDRERETPRAVALAAAWSVQRAGLRWCMRPASLLSVGWPERPEGRS